MTLTKWTPPGPGWFVMRPYGEEYQVFFECRNGPTKCLMQVSHNEAQKVAYFVAAANRLMEIDAEYEARCGQESAD